MKTFDVQNTVINAPIERAFDFIAATENLPRWASAFQRVSDGKALMQSPAGSVEIALRVDASRKWGTVDWSMTFPDGSVAKAYSRLVDQGSDSCIYSFLLTAPPVPLENIEGALDQQSRILVEELASLRKILEESFPGAQ
jgi:hypothetical protein